MDLEKKCEVCGKDFKTKSKDGDHYFCSRKCWNSSDYQKQYEKGWEIYYKTGNWKHIRKKLSLLVVK